MKVKQKVDFGIRSFTMPASEISARLLIEPDKAMVLGSRATVPKLVPVCHGWYVVCDKPGLCVDEQFVEVMTRVAPAVDR
ncbi:MAG: hypothetical protein QOG52_479, partial [Frankiaceae bacterium]|nr:hypothetical protein [Frankiaceae bacterium]